jgi:hypothetical protein
MHIRIKGMTTKASKYEFSILSSGDAYTGESPGLDRVVFNDNDALAGARAQLHKRLRD